MDVKLWITLCVGVEMVCRMRWVKKFSERSNNEESDTMNPLMLLRVILFCWTPCYRFPFRDSSSAFLLRLDDRQRCEWFILLLSPTYCKYFFHLCIGAVRHLFWLDRYGFMSWLIGTGISIIWKRAAYRCGAIRDRTLDEKKGSKLFLGKQEINETVTGFEKYKGGRWKNQHVLFREMRV